MVTVHRPAVRDAASSNSAGEAINLKCKDVKLYDASFAQGTDIRNFQEILGHKDPKTTMIYTRVTIHDLRSIKSPWDDMDL